jgi:hypothetical protein
MSLVVPHKTYEIPDDGVHNAEIVEVKDLGTVDTSFGAKHRVMLKYRTEQRDSKGESITVGESFNFTIGKGSRLADRVETLTGRRPSRDYDLEELVGWKGQIVVQHKDVDGTTYANVDTVLRKRGGN